MKKLIILFFLFQTVINYAQNTSNPNDFAIQFAEVVNEHISIFPKEDLKLLEASELTPGDEPMTYITQLENIPVSEAFINDNPKFKKLLKELYRVYIPLFDSWKAENANPADPTVEIMNFMDIQPNGRAVQYLFMYCLYHYDGPASK